MNDFFNARDQLKVGDKVTIHYRMVAVSVEAKSDKSEGKKKSK